MANLDVKRLLALLSILCACQSALSQRSLDYGRLESAHLLSSGAGWAATEHRIFWTTDAGKTWNEITPAVASDESIVAIFFLDTSTGWVLASKQAEPEPFFEIASTIDSGKSWSVNAVQIPNLHPEGTALGGDGNLNFIDSMHGWMNLAVVSSSNFNLGALFQTNDGGKTWNWAPNSPGVAGSVRFTSTNDGWLAGGPSKGELYATHDAARSWQKISLSAPPSSAAIYPVYDLPSFQDDKHGLLPVTYEGAEGAGLSLVLFATTDGGRTWTPSEVLPQIPETYHGEPIPSAIVNSGLVTASGGGAKVTLTKVANGRKTATSGTVANAQATSVSRLSFADDNDGWLVTSGGLLLTTDGGATWSNVTPPVVVPAYDPVTPGAKKTSAVAPTGWVRTASSAASSVPAGVSIHLGFDQCAAGTVAQMQDWWNHSMYFDTAIYIGGQSRSCAQPNLTASWVTQVRTQGWGLIPIWSGLQAPCACQAGQPGCTHFPHVFSSTPATAQSQGAGAAANAATAAAALGLPAEIIYLDLENYDSATCGAAAQAFVTGWVNQLHTKMPYAGVYGNAADANTDWPDIPDDVFIANWNFKVTVFGLNPLGDTAHWGVNQRAHQYKGGHAETHGSTTFNIDSDFDDAQIVVCSPECPGNQGLKSYTYSFQTIDAPAWPTWPTYWNGTTLNAINNSGVIVGSSLQALGAPCSGAYCNHVHGACGGWGCAHGFQYAGGQFAQVDFPGYPNDSQAKGVNNSGVIVGQYCGSWTGDGTNVAAQCGVFSGFQDLAANFSTIYFPGSSFTRLNGINDAGTILGECGGCDPSGYSSGYFIYKNGVSTDISISDQYQPGFPVYGSAGINGADQVAGISDGACCGYGAFLYNHSDGTIDYFFNEPNFKFAYGVNNNDFILGCCTNSPNPQYLMYDYANSSYFTLPVNYPGTTQGLRYYGLNDKGQLVGWYQDASDPTLAHGFLATPQ